MSGSADLILTHELDHHADATVRVAVKQPIRALLAPNHPLAHPKTRLEAITSRPKLLSAVGRMTSHAGQKKILLTITHEAAAQIKRLIVNVRAGLRHVIETAPQLDKPQCWFALVRYIVERILACQPKPNLGLTALATG